MQPIGVSLVFDPPPWPGLIIAAALVLGWEVLSLVRYVRSAREGVALAAMRRAAPAATGIAVLAAILWFWSAGGAILVMGAAGAAWAVRSYGRTTAPMKPKARKALLGLRLATVLLMAAWAIRPVLEYTHDEKVKAVLLIAIDDSASMQRRDMPADYTDTQPARGEALVSREAAVLQALQHQRRNIRSLTDRADVKAFSFAVVPGPAVDASDRRGPETIPLIASGQATAIGDSLAAVMDPLVSAGRDLAAILLISDGCNNTSDTLDPEKLTALMASRSVPIHTVGVGSDTVTGSAKMLTVKDLSAPDEVEAFNRLPVAATVEAFGLEGREVKATCRFGDHVVGTETIAVGDRQTVRQVRFVHVPLVAGFHRARVTAEVAGEPPKDLSGQGETGKLVHVVDREMRILYVEGKFRYETKYITQAMVAARRFTLDRRVLLEPMSPQRPPPLSEKLEDWLAYHAVIFGDVSAANFTAKQLQIVRDLVGTYGKGFCMIGGSESFGRGGWADTPIADVLPIDLKASKGQIEGEVRPAPTRDGLTSELMRIGDDEDVAAAWSKLPPLTGANRLVGLKPGAAVLAATPRDEPLIVGQNYGKGRSLAIAFDTTWRWVLTPKDTAELQKRFWRQVAMYLASPKGNVWVVTDKTEYDLRRLQAGSDAIEVTAGAEDARGRPVTDVPLTITLTTPDGASAPVQLAADKVMLRGKLPPPRTPGVHTLKISAKVEGRELTAEHRFEVLHRDLESMDLLANHNLLRRMSGPTQGRFVTLAAFEGLLRELNVSIRPKTRQVITREDLSAGFRWPVVVLLIALLCAEWAMRKRKGLV